MRPVSRVACWYLVASEDNAGDVLGTGLLNTLSCLCLTNSNRLSLSGQRKCGAVGCSYDSDAVWSTMGLPD